VAAHDVPVVDALITKEIAGVTELEIMNAEM